MCASGRKENVSMEVDAYLVFLLLILCHSQTIVIFILDVIKMKVKGEITFFFFFDK